MKGMSEATAQTRSVDTALEGREAGARAEASPEQRIGSVQEQVGGIKQRLADVEQRLSTFAASDETTPEEAQLEEEAQMLMQEMARLEQQAGGLSPADADKPAVESTEMDELSASLDQLYAEPPSEAVSAQIKVVEERMNALYEEQGFVREPAAEDPPDVIEKRAHDEKTAAMAEQGRTEMAQDEPVDMDALGKRLDDLYAQPQTPETDAAIDQLQKRMSRRMEREGLVREPDKNVIPPDVLEQKRHAVRTAELAELGRQDIAAEEYGKKKGLLQLAAEKAAAIMAQAKEGYDNRVRLVGVAQERLRVATERRTAAEQMVHRFADEYSKLQARLTGETARVDEAMNRVLDASGQRVYQASYDRTRFLQEELKDGVGKGYGRQDFMAGRAERKLNDELEKLNNQYNDHLKTKRPWIFGRKAWDKKKSDIEMGAGNYKHQLREVKQAMQDMRRELDALNNAYTRADEQHRNLQASESQKRYEALNPLQQQLNTLENQWRTAYEDFGTQNEAVAEEQSLVAGMTEKAREAERLLNTRQQELQSAQEELRALNTAHELDVSRSQGKLKDLRSPNTEARARATTSALDVAA